MQPIEGWNEAPAYTGEFETLPPGAYKCQVVQVNITKTQSGKEMMVICFDIAEGPFKDYYMKQFKSRQKTDKDVKYPGIFRQLTRGDSLPFFKGVITSIEKSNPGYRWNWEEKSLVKKYFGGIFGREEYMGNDGKKHMSTKCVQIRSLDGMKDAKIPEDKLLPDTPAPAFSTAAPQTQGASQNIPYIGQPGADGFMTIPEGIDDGELPFN